MKPIHYGALLLLGTMWGASFLFIGIAVHDFGPLTLMFLRVLAAGLILLAGVTLTQRPQNIKATLRLSENWRKFLTLGLLNCALPFTLIAYAELKVTASLAAILISTMPLFTAVIAGVWGSEQITGRKMWGVLLGIMGVAVLVGAGPLALNLELVIAVLALLLAACSYSAATVYAKAYISDLPTVYAATVQLLGAAVLLAAPAVWAAPSIQPSSTAIIHLAALILVSTTFAYLLYFFLLREVGPTRTASVTFLIPIFGTLWAIIFLREPFNTSMLVGMVIILTSVGLVTGVQFSKRKLVRSLKISDARET